MTDIVGGASAAVLGYITAGTRGAKVAYNLYRNYRNMPPISRKRKALYQLQSNSKKQTLNPSRRRIAKPKWTVTRTNPAGRGKVVNRRGSAKQSVKPGTNSYMSVQVSRRGNKVHKEGLKKKVFVSRQFRTKVKEALKNKGIFGSHTDISRSSMVPVDSIQLNADIGYVWDNKQSFFSPVQVLNAASVLFNQKLNEQGCGFLSAGMFSNRNIEIDVLQQYLTLRLKNNTARDLTVKIFACSPKGRQQGDGENALTYWNDAMAADAAGGVSDAINIGQNGLATRTAVTPATLGVTPAITPKFMNNYTLDTTTICLEPGKEYVYKLDGPTMLYKFSKYWSLNSRFDNQQKFIKQVIVSVITDITGVTSGNIGRFTDMTTGKGVGLLMELKQYIKLRVPEQAGINFTAIPGIGSYPLNAKRPTYFVQDWVQAHGAGTVVEYEDDNPVAPATGAGI